MAPAPGMGARPLRVGLTGGVASGKSTVAQLFAELGVPIIDTDEIARELTAPGAPLLAQVIAHFGEPLRRPDGTLDRQALRRIVFADADARRELESLLHPAIRARAEQLAERAGGPYQLHLVPLLVESGLRSRYDRVLVVDCPEPLQLARLQARDAASAEQARAMLAAQAPRAARLVAADDVIVNDGTIEALRPQIAALDRRYRTLRTAC